MAKVGNVGGYHGTDSLAATHDSGETGAPSDANFAYQTWVTGTTVQTGDYIEHSGKFSKHALPQITSLELLVVKMTGILLPIR